MLGAKLREKYPERVPVIFTCHKNIVLKKAKYLAPTSNTVAELFIGVRSQITLKRNEAMFVLVNNTLVANTALLGTVYEEHKDPEDEILYMHITKENTFG